MTNTAIAQARQWVKTSPHPLARTLFKQLKFLRRAELPAWRPIFVPLYTGYRTVGGALTGLARMFWWTPLLKARLQRYGRGLYLYGGLPYISGPVQIELGNDCRLSGRCTISGRASAPYPPQLSIGDNVDIGWMSTLAVGSRIEIGDNVRIAGRALLAGYPGHPLDPVDRATGLPETDEQVGNIVLEPDVWLATGVSVMAGVRIGHGTVVAAGSVVTRDLPSMVLAGGVPARVIRPLAPAGGQRDGA